MAELTTLSLAALGAAALTEGIKFLYGQAGELLKRCRERRDAASKTAASSEPATESVTVVLPETVFAGQLSAPQLHFAELDRLAEPMRQLRKELGDYVEGIKTVNSSDEGLIKIVDALRQTLEGVYQQRLTFKGEQRPKSGPIVEGRVDVDRVFGVASGVVAEVIGAGAQVRGEAKAGTVEAGADLAGVWARKIGG
jgi:hypothetical protein